MYFQVLATHYNELCHLMYAYKICTNGVLRVINIQEYSVASVPVADPGFAIGGGVNLVRGGTASRYGYISKICMSK